MRLRPGAEHVQAVRGPDDRAVRAADDGHAPAARGRPERGAVEGQGRRHTAPGRDQRQELFPGLGRVGDQRGDQRAGDGPGPRAARAHRRVGEHRRPARDSRGLHQVSGDFPESAAGGDDACVPAPRGGAPEIGVAGGAELRRLLHRAHPHRQGQGAGREARSSVRADRGAAAARVALREPLRDFAEPGRELRERVRDEVHHAPAQRCKVGRGALDADAFDQLQRVPGARVQEPAQPAVQPLFVREHGGLGGLGLRDGPQLDGPIRGPPVPALPDSVGSGRGGVFALCVPDLGAASRVPPRRPQRPLPPALPAPPLACELGAQGQHPRPRSPAQGVLEAGRGGGGPAPLAGNAGHLPEVARAQEHRGRRLRAAGRPEHLGPARPAQALPPHPDAAPYDEAPAAPSDRVGAAFRQAHAVLSGAHRGQARRGGGRGRRAGDGAAGYHRHAREPGLRKVPRGQLARPERRQGFGGGSWPHLGRVQRPQGERGGLDGPPWHARHRPRAQHGPGKWGWRGRRGRFGRRGGGVRRGRVQQAPLHGRRCSQRLGPPARGQGRPRRRLPEPGAGLRRRAGRPGGAGSGPSPPAGPGPRRPLRPRRRYPRLRPNPETDA
mmetsp:Transcript_60211/g.136141  ORF Transcript_60211/g.136141 Transcript_60211/m.136141 type:complete len:610 (-) Transcript_60211:237-2066(-)